MTINDMKDEVKNFKTAEMRFVLNILIVVREFLDEGKSWDNAIESLKRVDAIRYLEKQNSSKNKKMVQSSKGGCNMMENYKKNRRNQFTKVKNQILKENNLGDLICARCGYVSSSNHLHHLKEIMKGGNDDPYNLIPLCGDCHGEWDIYDELGYSFGEFLITPCTFSVAVGLKFGMMRMPDDMGTLMFKNLRSLMFASYAFKYGSDIYYTELEKQNEVFCRYPYSDHDTMVALFGATFEKCSLQELKNVSITLVKSVGRTEVAI